MPHTENSQAAEDTNKQHEHDGIAHAHDSPDTRRGDDASAQSKPIRVSSPAKDNQAPPSTKPLNLDETGNKDQHPSVDLNHLTPQEKSACIAFLATAAEASAPPSPQGDDTAVNKEAAIPAPEGKEEPPATERDPDVTMDAVEEAVDHSSPPEFDMSEFAESNLQAIAAAQIAAGLGDLDFGVAEQGEASTSAAAPEDASDDAASPKRGIKRRRSSAAGQPMQPAELPDQGASSGSPSSLTPNAPNGSHPRNSIGSTGPSGSSHTAPNLSQSTGPRPAQTDVGGKAQPSTARPPFPSTGSARPQLPSAPAGQRPPPPPPTTSTNRPPPTGPGMARPTQPRTSGGNFARPPPGGRPPPGARPPGPALPASALFSAPPPGARPPGPALPASALFSAAPPGAPSFASLLSTLGPQDLAMVAQAAMGLDAEGNPLPGNEESHRALADAMRRLRESATARPPQAPPSRPPPPKPSPSSKSAAPKAKQPPKAPKARQASAEVAQNASSPARSASASASLPPDNGDAIDALPRTGNPLEDKKPLIAGPKPDRAPPKPGPPPEKRFQCPKCDRAFARAYNLNTHLSTHDPDPNRSKPFPCPYPSCRTENRSFSRKHDLQRHIASTHESEPEPILEVAQGEGGEVVQSNLAKLGLGAPGRKFRCQCGRAFVRRDALRRHQCDATKGSADFEGSDSNMSPSANRSRSKNARSNVDYESEDELDLTDFDAIAASFTAAAEEELRAAAEQEAHPPPEDEGPGNGGGDENEEEQEEGQEGEGEEEEQERDELDLTDFDAIAASFTAAAEEEILAAQDPEGEEEGAANGPSDAPAAPQDNTEPTSLPKEDGLGAVDRQEAVAGAAAPEVKLEQEQH